MKIAIMVGALALVATGCATESVPTPSPTAFPESPACTEKAILAGLDLRDGMQAFTCAPLQSGYWAAATVNNPKKPEVFFLTATDGKWQKTASPCGQSPEPAGMTEQILDYCQNPN